MAGSQTSERRESAFASLRERETITLSPKWLRCQAKKARNFRQGRRQSALRDSPRFQIPRKILHATASLATVSRGTTGEALMAGVSNIIHSLRQTVAADGLDGTPDRQLLE